MGGNSYVFQIVDGSNATWQMYRTLVPARSHRSQILQHVTSFGIHDAFYVVASAAGSSCHLIRIVHLRFTDSVLAAHNSSVKYLSKFLEWTDGGIEGVPELTNYHYAMDRESVQQDLLIWKEINRLFEERGRPFPRIKHIIALLAAIHNKLKIGVDGSSRLAANAAARHGKLKPMAQFLLRTLSDTFLNTFQLKSLLDMLDWLLDTEHGPQLFLEYCTRRNNTCSPFSDFCLRLARSRITYIDPLSSEISTLSTVLPELLPETTSNKSTFKYKLALNCNNDKTSTEYMVRTTITTTMKHGIAMLEKQSQSCQLCCRKHSDGELKKHNRKGYQPKTYCGTCGVVLCTKKRWDADINYVDRDWKDNPALSTLEYSCFDVWHLEGDIPTLNASCKVEGKNHAGGSEQIRPTVAPTYRRPVRPSSASLSSESDVGQKRKRRSSTGVELGHVRRSQRGGRRVS